MKTIGDHFAPAERCPSAEMVAVLRAAHQVLDQPVVHADPLAMRIIGAQGRGWLEANPTVVQLDYVHAIRAMVVVRSRHCEDELCRAVARGTTQYVVLGAGLDTFAYRQPEFARDLTIFELDEPRTQRWKLERLQEAGIPVPANLRFVPVDFNAGTIATALAAAGFDREAPAFFAWLGVSYYLPQESIIETMRFVATQGAASAVVFDFALSESAAPRKFLHIYHKLRSASAKAAEPWITWLVPGELRATLEDLGFTEVEMLDAPAMTERFLRGREDGLMPGYFLMLAVARRQPVGQKAVGAAIPLPGNAQSPPAPTCPAGSSAST